MTKFLVSMIPAPTSTPTLTLMDCTENSSDRFKTLKFGFSGQVRPAAEISRLYGHSMYLQTLLMFQDYTEISSERIKTLKSEKFGKIYITYQNFKLFRQL